MSFMKIFKNLIPLLLLINLHHSIKAKTEPTEITINYSEYLSLETENYFVIKYSEEDLIDIEYLTITTRGPAYDTPAFIYISLTEENPSAEERLYTSQNLGKNEIIISVAKLHGYSRLYINLHTLKEGQIQFDVKPSIAIHLSIGDDKIKFKLSDVRTINYRPELSDLDKIIMLYGVGENIDFFKMSVKYLLDDGGSQEFTPEQKFDNGYGVIVDLSQINANGTFEIEMIPNENHPKINSTEKEVEVGLDITNNDGEITEIIDIMDHIYGYISDKKQCYQIIDFEETKDVTILLNVYTQALTFSLYQEGNETYSLDVFHNSYIKLTSETISNHLYFCFKKFTPKENEEEELGEISFDFQIYYDDELTKVQSYLFPLVNGKMYTNSLKNDEIMLYRHTSFNTYNYLYSSTMMVHRGKPVLYGYECDTYPECNLDKAKFNEMKEKGKIEVINKINSYYLHKKDLAKDDMGLIADHTSQSRRQYFSLVMCESGEDLPNKGECQYTIEIDNENDEIEIIPDIVHANSMLFLKNYFRIRITDHENTNYLKIYFTVLTGNADINIYTDKNHDVPAVFTYRHVHRKEIFEKKGNISKNYYLVINTEEPAFVEIKYETDFHYKGYIRLNPNEINIQYLNKNNYFSPYSTYNPDYFYPISNPKNHDFYFTIHPLDCSVVYKYEFKDYYNVTYWHHEVPTDSIYFGSSFGFELKLDNYFHTPSSDKEDCPILIYTGEKSKDIPLLIMEDIFHPSHFKETYYVFPFTISNNVASILVQIQFNKETLTKFSGTPSVDVVFKLMNQVDNFETYTISKDSAFVIDKEKIKKYCPKTFYQCSLTIELIKKDESDEKDNSYTLLTNVHSAFDSVEYILKNKIYSYNLRPKDSRYFYTQIDKDEEGEINFMFNKGNANVFAKMVEKDNIETGYNWNGRVKLPDPYSEDLLYYD